MYRGSKIFAIYNVHLGRSQRRGEGRERSRGGGSTGMEKVRTIDPAMTTCDIWLLEWSRCYRYGYRKQLARLLRDKGYFSEETWPLAPLRQVQHFASGISVRLIDAILIIVEMRSRCHERLCSSCKLRETDLRNKIKTIILHPPGLDFPISVAGFHELNSLPSRLSFRRSDRRS